MNSGLVTLLLFILPLGLDTFAIAAVVGASRPSRWARWRTSAIFVLFEGGMPLVGLALGSSLGHAIGSMADYLSGGLLVGLSGYLWWTEGDHDDDDDEVAKAKRLTSARGLALLGLAFSISLDELAIGFSLGLGSHPTRPATIIALIAIQTLIISQLGLSLGTRISARLRDRIERLTNPVLAALGGYQLTGALIHTGLLTALDTAALATLTLILTTAIIHRVKRNRQQTVQPQTPCPPAFWCASHIPDRGSYKVRFRNGGVNARTAQEIHARSQG